MRISMITMEQFDNRRPNSVGSSRIRGNWVMKYCREIEPFKLAEKYDAIIYQKAYWKEHMEMFKGIKIFDICDPDWLEGRPITEVFDLVDAVTVPTKPLQDYLTQLTDKPVVLIPDRIDPDAHFPIKTEHSGKLRTVVWFGYSQNQKVLEPVVNVLQQYNLQLVVISDRAYPQADVNIIYKYETINEDITKYDAVVLPNIGSENFRFSMKSNNKVLTSWALGMPVITEVDDIQRFMDAEARKKESELKLDEVIHNWHVRDSGREYLELIHNLSTKQRR